jgi:hypothetical protein
VLAYLRKGETFAQLAAGFSIGRTTAWRYVNETVELLAARAPKLAKTAREAKKAGHAYVILDGTLIPIDRVAADKPFYSGKHKRHGMNLQVIASPDGDIPTKGRTSPGRRKRPTAPPRDSAPPVSGPTHSSRHGRSSPSSAAARGAPGNSRKPSTHCSSARRKQVGISSVSSPMRSVSTWDQATQDCSATDGQGTPYRKPFTKYTPASDPALATVHPKILVFVHDRQGTVLRTAPLCSPKE